MSLISKLSFLEKYKEYGVIFIRLMIGFHLVYGIQVYIFSYARMEITRTPPSLIQMLIR